MALNVSAYPTDPYNLGQLYPYVIPSSGGATDTTSSSPVYDYGSGGGSSGGSTSATSTSTVDPALLAQYDQAISNTQSAIDRLPTQLTSGNQAIDSSFTNAINQLLAAKNQAQGVYKTNKQQTAQDFVVGKNTIRSNAGNSLGSLRRILGSRGAGGSSAYRFAAPDAVTRNATIQQNDLGQTFGRNNQALDTNWGNYLTDYNNEVSSATNQRDTQKRTLQSQIDTNRASLLQSLATLVGQKTAEAGGNTTAAAQPYLDQANKLLDATSKYTTAPINYQTKAYNAPDLAKYIVNPNAAPTYQGQTVNTDYVSPYLAALLGGSANKKQQPNLAGA